MSAIANKQFGSVWGLLPSTFEQVAGYPLDSLTKNGTGFGMSGAEHLGTYRTTEETQAAQLASDQAAVNAGKADILNSRTILTIAGTFDLAANDAAVAAAQLVTDQAAVTAGKADILNTRTILTIVGTFDLAANDAAVAAAQLVTDKAAVTAAVATILDSSTILTVTGTYHAPSQSEVWHTAVYGPLSATPGLMVASDIANCEAANIKDDVVIDDVTGTYGGGTTSLAIPTLALADQADGTGATATIAAGSATATNTVYTSQDGLIWTAGGTRVGNGTVDLTLAVGRWWVYVHAVEGAAAANSPAHAVNVTSAVVDPTAANCLAAVAAAVAVKVNAGKTAAHFARNDFTAGVVANTDLLLENAGEDVLHVDVATGDVKTEYVSRASRAFDCRADVCLRIRPSAATVAERDALLALLGALEDYLKPVGGDPCTLDTYAEAIWVGSEIRTPWVPDHWPAQYTGIFSVTFRVHAD